jgi:thiamine transport system substrate-binding protein
LVVSAKKLALSLSLAVFFSIGTFVYFRIHKSDRGDQSESAQKSVRVLAYSSFVQSWGAGPEVARLFHEATGLTVEFHDGGDAGLLLKKLQMFPSDVVLGLDQWTLDLARKQFTWLDMNQVVTVEMSHDFISEFQRWRAPEFIPIDWAPMAFVFRKSSGFQPPHSLDELLDERFRNQISLQDPRTSSPGLQFLFWVLDEKGIEGGFDYLKRLKPNLRAVSPSWSTAYGLFTNGQAQLVLSYVTSPVYHWTEESNELYQATVFSSGHPVQIEYAAIPKDCVNCEGGEMFVRFLLKPEIQKLIMSRNFMLPVVRDVTLNTPFARLPEFTVRENRSVSDLIKRRDELFARWRQLGL